MSVLKEWVKEALEDVDAGLFTCDTFHSEEALKELNIYIVRWQKQMSSIRQEFEEEEGNWWHKFSMEQEHISTIVARFAPKLSSAFSIAIQQKHKIEVLWIMNEVWCAAPDSPVIHFIPGWGALCDLCAE